MARPRGVAGLIFDVDGTLIDSNELHAKAWADAFREAGRPIPLARIRPHIGKGGDLLVPDLLDARGMREIGRQVEKARSRIFRERYLPKVRPFPGIRRLFQALREKGIRIVLASSAPAREIEAHLETLGVAELVDGTTSADDAEFSKPSPEIFRAALDRIPAPRSRTVVVGDTPYDILAAHRTATPIVAVRSGGFSDESLRKAEWIVDAVPDILRRLPALDAYFRR